MQPSSAPNNAGLSARNRAKAAWLDQALADQPPAIRAKVLDFALKFGVEADDSDFWMLIAAVGFLHTIVESAPQEWRGLFSNFTNTLDQWTSTNQQLLQAYTIKAETDATQAELIRELALTLRALATLIHEQKQALVRLGTSSTKQNPLSSAIPQPVTQQLNAVQRQLEHLDETMAMALQEARNASNLGQNMNKSQFAHQSRNVLLNVSASICGLLIVGIGAVSCVLLQGQLRQAEQIGWLLYKANRAECLAGIQPPDSELCQGL